MAIEASGTFKFDDQFSVFRMGFGALRIIGDQGWGPPKDPNNSISLLEECMNLGINSCIRKGFFLKKICADNQ